MGSAGHCFAQGLPVYFLMLDALHADPRGWGKSWWTDKNPQPLPRSSSPYDSRWRDGSPEEQRDCVPPPGKQSAWWHVSVRRARARRTDPVTDARRFAPQPASGRARANIVTCSAVLQQRNSSVAAQARKKGEHL